MEEAPRVAKRRTGEIFPEWAGHGWEPEANGWRGAGARRGDAEAQGPADWNEEARRHPTVLIRRTLRSGQTVRFGGNVVVLGDVNPGAEITAGGDIVVMGWLRGVAHAGARGDQRAIVSAFRLAPTQLRIAHLIARAPDDGEDHVPDVPEYAEIRNGQLVIDRWPANR
ncbi:MAG: septum site-determining protein MinC [Firmicutes bacterium]|nr:septum site-determining protein MinC [Alicyclobacillaceae bacterium]MCL6496983.1 septum site-determining protein MinC [Bacillota bacterium]